MEKLIAINCISEIKSSLLQWKGKRVKIWVSEMTNIKFYILGSYMLHTFVILIKQNLDLFYILPVTTGV